MKKSEYLINLKSLVASASVVLASILLSKLFTYIYRVIVARTYGPEIYGVFTLGTMVVGFLISLSALGFSDGLSRFISLYRGKKEVQKVRYLFAASFKIITFSSIIAGAILFIFADYISLDLFDAPQLSIFLKIFAVITPPAVMATSFLYTLRAYEKITEFSIAYNILLNLGRLIVLGLLIFVGMNFPAIAYSYSAGFLFMFLAAFYLTWKYTPEVFGQENVKQTQKKKILGDLFKYSLPLVVSNLIYVILFWTDSFLLGLFKSPTEIGIYNAATPIAGLLLIAPQIFVQLFFPIITKEYAKGKNSLIRDLSKQVSKWIFIINLPAFALFFFFPGAAINTLFGQEYISALAPLRILIFGNLLFSFLSLSRDLVSMLGRSKLLLIDVMIATILNIVLNVLFIPMDKIFFIDNTQGISGAAIATSLSHIFLGMLYIAQSKKYISVIPIRRKMLNALMSVLIPFTGLWILTSKFEMNLFWIIISSILFLLIYAALLFVFRALDDSDKELISSTIRKFKR